ncbi:MAG: helix-turn-helix transcriptional regulator [Sphingomonadales bacterium]|nr:helix-turn-helix transcriptional regulator [Sphingomonadales bacterium]
MKNQLPEWAQCLEVQVAGFDLKAWRENLGLKQDQAAALLGITREQYGRLERRQHPLDQRTKLACFFLKNLCKFA